MREQNPELHHQRVSESLGGNVKYVEKIIGGKA